MKNLLITIAICMLGPIIIGVLVWLFLDSLIAGLSICTLLEIIGLMNFGSLKQKLDKRQEEHRIDKLSKSEKWGEYAPSKSGEMWFLGRRMTWSGDDSRSDSRMFLEGLGFVVLGIVDEKFYAVEPPKGWEMKLISGVQYKIFDETGKQRLGSFEDFDHQDSSFRAYVYQGSDGGSEWKNSLVRL